MKSLGPAFHWHLFVCSKLHSSRLYRHFPIWRKWCERDRIIFESTYDDTILNNEACSTTFSNKKSAVTATFNWLDLLKHRFSMLFGISRLVGSISTNQQWVHSLKLRSSPLKNSGQGRWNSFLLQMVSFLRGGCRSFSEGLLSGSLTAHPLKSYQFTIPKRKVRHLPTYPFFRGQLAVKLQDCNLERNRCRAKYPCLIVLKDPCWLVRMTI